MDVHVLMVASGSVSVLQLPTYITAFTQQGWKCRVVMTDSASAILPAEMMRTFAEVFTDADKLGSLTIRVPHIALGSWASVVLVLPATANTIAKLAVGIADNLATLTVLSSCAPVVVFPNVAGVMSRHRTLNDNLDRLRVLGYRVVDDQRSVYSVGRQRDEVSIGLPIPDDVVRIVMESIRAVEDVTHTSL